MCTVVLLRRPGHAWPLILAAHRDERLDRPWDPPAAHWPHDHPGTVGGRDRLAGGTWMALGPPPAAASGTGVLAAVLNRPGSLGPAAGKRSRGTLPLLAADAPDADAAAARLRGLDAGAYRPFNAVLADASSAWFLRGLGRGRPEAVPLPEGVSLVSAFDPDDPDSPRARRHRPRFRDAVPPDPDRDDWRAWEALLDDAVDEPPGAALRVPPRGGFGTVCASLLALAADGRRRWRFAAVPPDPDAAARFAVVPLP